MTLFILLLFTSFSFNSVVDEAPTRHQLEGYWSGVMTHPGGYIDSYTFILQLQKKGDNITGWSMVASEDIQAEMEMTGRTFQNSLLVMEDVKLLDQQINPGLEWCMKRYQLILIDEGNQLRLEGDWQGNTSFGTCDPGKVILTKMEPKA